jgi:hypothetical protein
MLRAGTLFYALTIAVVLAMMSGGLILTAHLERLRLQHDQRSDAIIRNAQSGLQLLLGKQQLVNYDAPFDHDLFGNEHDSVRLTLRRWGAYDVAISDAHNRTLRHTCMALTGWAARADDRTALRMANLERPLAITGNTLLRGTCYLPSGGVTSTYAESQSYTRNQLVYGEQRLSERFLPEPDKGLVRRIDSLLNGRFAVTDSLVAAAELNNVDSLVHSFLHAPVVLQSDGPILLRDKYLAGQWCIYSKSSIKVERSAELHDVILIAPNIEIADRVKGNFQAFARDSFSIGEEVELDYPSVIGMLTDVHSPPQTKFEIGRKTRIAGVVFGIQNVQDFTRSLWLKCDEETKITGQVWCNDLLQLKGEVKGDVSCKLFHLQTNSATYQNLLMNATIDRPARPDAFVLSVLVHNETDEKKIVKWLH